MASEPTWNVKGLTPEARETAREAARRSGLTTAEWLQSVIMDSAGGAKPAKSRRSAAARDDRYFSREGSHEFEPEARPSRQRAAKQDRDEFDPPPRRTTRGSRTTIQAPDIDGRLDQLSARLDELARATTQTAIPLRRASSGPDRELASTLRAIEGRLAEFGRGHADAAPDHISRAFEQINRRLDQIATEGRSASTELETRIAAVDRALSALGDDAARPQHGIGARAQAPSFSDNSAGPSRPTLQVPHTEAYTPPRPQDPEIEAPPTQPDNGTFGLDDALAEIAARQQALEAEPEGGVAQLSARLARQFGAPPRTPQPEDMSGLQHQLQQLTSQLENLRAVGGYENTVAALRRELLSIESKLDAAAPLRAVQALQTEIQALASRLDAGRNNGADKAALAGIEGGLRDVHAALQKLAPAESFVIVREELRALDRKVESIAAHGSDSSAMRDLERSIAELREVAARAASGEALIALAEEVQSLSDKIDRIAAPLATTPDILLTLEERFAELTTSLEQRITSTAAKTSASAGNLVAIVDRLAEKVERMHVSRDSGPILDQIAQQLGRLGERIDTSGVVRPQDMDSIDRGIAELLGRLDRMHADSIATAQAAAHEAALRVSSNAVGATFEVEELKHGIGALQQKQTQSEQRTQDTLEAVHGTLEQLVDRLAMVETDVRGAPKTEAPAPKPARAAEPADPWSMERAPIVPRATPEVAAEAAKLPDLAPAVTPERRPTETSLPADQPVEPGMAAQSRQLTAAERIAASEAVLDSVKPTRETESKANFIAAARRAAQAAANMAPSVEAETREAGSKPARSAMSALAQRLSGKRPLVLACAILAIAGTLHIVLNTMGANPLSRTVPAQKTAERTDDNQKAPAPSAQSVLASAAKAPAPTPSSASSALPPLGITAARQQTDEAFPATGSVAAAPSRAETPAAPAPAGETARSSSTTTPGVSPLTIASIKLPTDGSQSGRTAGFSMADSGPMPQLATAADARFGSIGQGLRAAALAGDPAAEYEIALRFTEGRGVAVSLEEAAEWFERAADQGLTPAQYRLASLYEKGQGVKKDIEKARRLYTIAADKGNAKAMHNLAVIYAEGSSGTPDFKMASAWFRKAADRGVADSQYNLAILHARGLGVEQNLAESYKWFALAAGQGDQDAGKKRDEVASRLDQQALVAARLAVQTFTAVSQPVEATTVPTPAGGWETATAPAKPARRSGAAAPSRKTGST